MIRAALAAAGLLTVAHSPALTSALVPTAAVTVAAQIAFVTYRLISRRVRHP